MTIFLQGTTAAELAVSADIDLADARRLLARVHRHGELPAVAFAGVRRLALEAVRAVGSVPKLELLRSASSSVDPFIKCVFGLPDGQRIESVCWPLQKPERVVACVSSQAGCALACAFCATGALGLNRNLAAWEIVEQVHMMRKHLKEGQRIHGIVFQGMGEPLANTEQVIRAIRVLSEPYGPAIDRRRMTVSTAGIPSGILRLAHEAPEVRLGISIGSARPGKRADLMPIQRRFPLQDVLVACSEHAKQTRLSPMFSYTLIAGHTDTAEDALAFVALAKSFHQQSGSRPRISLIPFNDVEGSAFEPPSLDSIVAFRQRMHDAGVGTKLRYSGGGDVGAACGQLVGA